MMSLCGYADKAHPFFFERNFLYTVSILLCFLLVAEKGVVNGKAENLLNSVKRKLEFLASVAFKKPPKRLIFAQ